MYNSGNRHFEGGATMYQVGEKIVHPMHGAGVVDEIVDLFKRFQ